MYANFEDFSGQVSLDLETAARLASALGMEITFTPAKARRRSAS